MLNKDKEDTTTNGVDVNTEDKTTDNVTTGDKTTDGDTTTGDKTTNGEDVTANTITSVGTDAKNPLKLEGAKAPSGQVLKLGRTEENKTGRENVQTDITETGSKEGNSNTTTSYNMTDFDYNSHPLIKEIRNNKPLLTAFREVYQAPNPDELKQIEKQRKKKENAATLIEALKMISDIGTAFGGGNVYKRESSKDMDKIIGRYDKDKKAYDDKLNEYNKQMLAAIMGDKNLEYSLKNDLLKTFGMSKAETTDTTVDSTNTTHGTKDTTTTTSGTTVTNTTDNKPRVVRSSGGGGGRSGGGGKGSKGIYITKQEVNSVDGKTYPITYELSNDIAEDVLADVLRQGNEEILNGLAKNLNMSAAELQNIIMGKLDPENADADALKNYNIGMLVRKLYDLNPTVFFNRYGDWLNPIKRGTGYNSTDGGGNGGGGTYGGEWNQHNGGGSAGSGLNLD